MADSLYPVFDIPDIDEDDDQEEEELKAGPLFDFEIGDFALDGQNRVVFVDGNDLFMLWVVKALQTQVGAYRSYYYFGIDQEGAEDQPDREAVESALERTISEMLMTNPQVEDVDNFIFSWEGSNLYVTFIVTPKNWDAFDVNMALVE